MKKTINQGNNNSAIERTLIIGAIAGCALGLFIDNFAVGFTVGTVIAIAIASQQQR